MMSYHKVKKGSTPIMQKLTSLFKKEKETGHISVRPACFVDAPDRRMSESPEPSGTHKRKSESTSASKRTWKAEGGKNASGVGWRPKVYLSVNV